MNNLLVISLLFLSACDYKDSRFSIAKNYYFSINDRNSRNITYYNKVTNQVWSVVDNTVEEYYVWENYIFASRRERIKDNEGRIINISKCEYWFIDINTHKKMGPYVFKELSSIEAWNLLNESFHKKILLKRTSLCPLVW